ncbi:MAG: DEAD/DEAH box helicase [Fusobacteriaceae bacterium]
MSYYFNKLDKQIQKKIHEMKWENLRPIQEESIEKIQNTRDHLIISASTASGKTEAAFFPIISEIINNNEEEGFQTIYIGPLKALINDQFQRMETLCEKCKIPVFKWHGDVSESHKKKAKEKPKGILLITPESLESLFINHTNKLPNIFNNLKYVVIDEMHSFIGSERGAQLKSLILRLKAFNNDFRCVGLSATLGDIDKAKEWLSENTGKKTQDIQDKTSKTKSLMIFGYENDFNLTEATKKDQDITEKLRDDILFTFKDKTSLIFGNSRVKLEYFADAVISRARELKISDNFRVHHGSLSKIERETVEKEVKSNQIFSVFCSSTLEMGIDIGSVSVIGQLDTPWSVNSLAQRWGRGGRKDGEKSIMYMFLMENEATDSSSILDKLYLDFIKSIALVELFVKDKWIETPKINKLHLSTFVHQILSVIAQFGGINAFNLYESLILKGAFNNISKDIFIKTLKCLSAEDLIEQSKSGELFLGLKGERLVRNFKFYSVFKDSDEIKVIYNSKEIGTIANELGLAVGGYFILSGKRWKIIEIYSNKEIIVEPSKGKKLPVFEGTSFPETEKEVRYKMLDILKSSERYSYLDKNASEMLNKARHYYNLIPEKEEILFEEGTSLVWFTWTSSPGNLTLHALLTYFLKLDVILMNEALILKNIIKKELKTKLLELNNNYPTTLEIANLIHSKKIEKYDYFLSDELLSYSFATNHLNLEDAKLCINELLNGSHQENAEQQHLICDMI